jgi:hypothetical protein
MKKLLGVLLILILTACSELHDTKGSRSDPVMNSSVKKVKEDRKIDLSPEEEKFYKRFKESDDAWAKMSEKEKIDLLSKIKWNGFGEVMISEITMIITQPSLISKEQQYTVTYTDSYDFSKGSKEQSKKILSKLNPLSESLHKDFHTPVFMDVIPNISNLDLTPKKSTSGLYTIFDVKARVDFVKKNDSKSYELFLPDAEYSFAKNTLQMKTIEFKKLN